MERYFLEVGYNLVTHVEMPYIRSSALKDSSMWKRSELAVLYCFLFVGLHLPLDITHIGINKFHWL